MDKKKFEDEERKWKCKHDFETLVEARKIEADEDRLKGAMEEYDRQMKALKGFKKAAT